MIDRSSFFAIGSLLNNVNVKIILRSQFVTTNSFSTITLKNTPAPNTDNKGYKTCHGFCKPFLLSREHSIRGHHRDGAAALYQICVSGQIFCSQKALYRDTRKTHKTCNWTAKTAPCFAHSGWCRDVTPIRLHCSSLHSLSNTNALNCRAVTVNTGHTTNDKISQKNYHSLHNMYR